MMEHSVFCRLSENSVKTERLVEAPGPSLALAVCTASDGVRTECAGSVLAG